MMSNFDLAIQTVLSHEGSFVADPYDIGGATNYGISLRWLQSVGDIDKDSFLEGDLNKDGTVDIKDIKKIDQKQAIEFYRKY